MKKQKNIFIILSILSIIGCRNNCASFKKNDSKIYGLDVSHYQNIPTNINWEKVVEFENPKIDFVYIRTTMGTNGVDAAFDYNFKEATKHQLAVGVYHYYRPNERAEDQLKNFLQNNTTIGDLPPVIDIEERCRLGPRVLKKELLLFLEGVEKKYQKKPILYAHQKFYNTYLRNSFQDYNFWIARHSGIQTSPKNNQPQKEPVLLDRNCPTIWQYTSTGEIDGIIGFVDINIAKNKFWINQ